MHCLCGLMERLGKELVILETMKTISFGGELQLYERIEDLADNREQELCRRAVSARAQAYAVYSGFDVGVSILLDNGEIVLGSNQENAVYPLGLCAERVAMFSSQNLYPSEKMISMALVTSSIEEASEIPVFPCGSCRQAIVEQEYRQQCPIRILVISSNGKVYVVEGIKNLLPFTMDKDTLDNNKSSE